MKRTIILSLILVVLNLNGFGQMNPVVQGAFQKINAGQLDEAITDLNELLIENPDNYMALSFLGLAFRNKKEFDKSLSAYLKANKSQPENVRGMFNLGIAYALNNDKNNAFEILMKLKGTNSFNITNIGLSPAASILMDDPRYAKLFPSPKEYADPFSEKGVEIIYDWKGENANDQFGWVARNIGDVDGDGVLDLTSSAPTNNEGATSAGKIYVYSAKSGALLWSHAATDENGQLGMSIEAAGDVNGDGIPDVVAGAPYVNKVWVFSGIDGKVIHEWIGNNSSGAFGIGVKGIGDVNDDGHSDVLIGEPFQIWGAPFNSDKIDQPGNVYLYSGKDGTVLQKWQGERIGDGFGTAVSGKVANEKTTLMIGAPSAGANNGGQVNIYKKVEADSFFSIMADSTSSGLGAMFMSVVGDVNGDMVQDVYASDFSNNALGGATGRAYVYSGADGKELYTLTGEHAGDGFGIGVADAGDTNNDGFDDLVIGAWQYAAAAPSGGKVYVYSGKDGQLLRTLTGKIVGETLGFDATGIGDVNGDGIVDLLLTSAWSAINGVRSGRTYIIAGKK